MNQAQPKQEFLALDKPLTLSKSDAGFSRPRKPKRSRWILGLLIFLCAGAYGLWLTSDRLDFGQFGIVEGLEPFPGTSLGVTLVQEQQLEFPELPPLGRGEVAYTVQVGDSLPKVIEALGFSREESDSVNTAIDQAKEQEKFRSALRVGQKLELVLGEAGSLESLTTKISPESSLSVARNQSGAFEAKVEALEREERERIIVGSIESSFAAAATSAGLGYDIVDDLVDIFSDRVSFHKDFQKGDRFTVIFHEHRLSDGTRLATGPILAAALETKGTHLKAIRYVGTDGKARYFDETGKLLGNTFLRYPLKFSRISSYFTNARFHPVLKIRRPHNGVDFAAPVGTPVRTVADGLVTFAGRKGGSGIMLEIKHSDRYTTQYLHLSKITTGIRKGSRVRLGEVVGAVGMTGLSTGPHLHYGLFENGKYIDPLKVQLPQSEDLTPGTRIGARYLKRALFTLEHYQSVSINNFFWESQGK